MSIAELALMGIVVDRPLPDEFDLNVDEATDISSVDPVWINGQFIGLYKTETLKEN